MEDTYNDKDPLGLEAALQERKNADPLGLEAALKKKDATAPGTVSSVGITERSPSSSVSKSPTPRVNPFQKIADIDKRQHDAANILLPKQFGDQDNEVFTEQMRQNRLAKIMQGDVETIVDVVKRQKDANKKSLEKANVPVATTDPLYFQQGPDEEAQRARAEEERVKAYDKDITETAAKAIAATYTKKYLEAPTEEEKKKLAPELRKALSEIGADPTFNKELAQLAGVKAGVKITARPNEFIDFGTPSAPKKNPLQKVADDAKERNQGVVQKNDYNNQVSLLNAVNQTLSEKIEELADDQNVQAFMNGDAATRERLKDLPAVKQAIDASGQLRKNIEDLKTLPSKFPQVKAEQDRQKVIDEFARQTLKKQRFRNEVFGQGANGIDILVGDRLTDDDEIKAVAQATGLSEDRVREFADDAAIPSLLGQALRAAGGVSLSSVQYLNRISSTPGDAELQNLDIEENIYRTPEPLTKLNNVPNVLRTMADGFGQFVGYVGLTRGISGTLGVAGRAGASLLAPAAEAATVNLPRVGRLLNTASNWLERGEAVNVGSALDKVAKAGERARELAATYGSGYASSYEGAYKEAQTFTADPDKIESYANSIAFLNGVSELILPDIDVAKKIAALSGMKALLRDGRVGLSQADLAKEFVTRIASTVGQEVLEEYIPMVGEMFEKNRLFNYQTSGNDFLQQLGETTLQTAVSTVPMALLGGGASSSSHFTKSLMYEVGKTPEKYLAQIDALSDQGVLDEEKTRDRKKMVGTMADILQKLPATNNAGAELSENQKVELSAQIFQQRYNEALKTTTDKSLHRGYDNKIKEAQDVINFIMNGGQVRQDIAPVPEAQPEEEAAPELDEEDLNADPILNQLMMLGGLENVVTTEDTTQPEPADLSELILQRNNQTLEALTPGQSMTVIVPNHLGALATMVGATTTAVGKDNTQVTLTGAQLLDLRNLETKNKEDAIIQSQRQEQESGIQSSGQEPVGAAQREQESQRQEEAITGTDGSNRVRGSQETQEEITARLERARAGIVETEPTLQENLARSRAEQERRDRIERERRIRNELPKPRIRIRVGENGTYQIVSNENTEDQSQLPETAIAGAEAAANTGTATPAVNLSPEPTPVRIAGTYQFGQVQNVNVNDIYEKGFRRDKPNIESAKHFRNNPTNNPILLFRHPNGTVHVLDGRAQLAAHKADRKRTIPARYFHGTVEEAREFAELSRNIPTSVYVSQRISRVLAKQPESFREKVLQDILGIINKVGRKPAFSRIDLVRVMGFGGVNQNRLSMNYGKRVGVEDIKNLSARGVVSENPNRTIWDFDVYVQEWINSDMNRDNDNSETELINQLGDILVSHQTKEEALTELERLQGIEGTALVAQALPFHMTEEEAIYVGDKDMHDWLSRVVNNVSEDDLSQAEYNVYRDIIMSNSTPDGVLNMEAAFNELTSSNDPAVASLREKLLYHARQQKQEADEPGGDFGSETFTAEPDAAFFDEETGKWLTPVAEFSRPLAQQSRPITVRESQRVVKVLSKAFKGLKVHFDADALSSAIKSFFSASKPLLSERAVFLMDKLQHAQAELKTAQAAFNSKRQQLDRGIRQDTEDLFGERPAAATAGMFDERVDVKARDAAMKPFKDRLDKAKKNVNDLQTKLNEALKDSGPQQTAMFSKSTPAQVVDGFYSPIEARINGVKQNNLSANKWIELLGKGDEARFTGLLDFLAEKKPAEQITKNDLLAYMATNRVEIREVVRDDGYLAALKRALQAKTEEYKAVAAKRRRLEFIDKKFEEADALKKQENELQDQERELQRRVDAIEVGLVEDGSNTPKYAQWQLVGKKSGYKEVLLTLPAKGKAQIEEYNDALRELYNQEDEVGYDMPTADQLAAWKIARERAADLRAKLPEGTVFKLTWSTGSLNTQREYAYAGNEFKSNHWEEPNIIAHIRMNVREDSKGNKVLFVEEIQSDWGQKGKRDGFVNTKAYEEEKSELQKQLKVLDIREKENVSKMRELGLPEMASSSERRQYNLRNVPRTRELNRVLETVRTNREWDLIQSEINLIETQITSTLMEETAISSQREIIKSRIKTVEKNIADNRRDGVPVGPYVSDTNAWTKLALKYALRHAINEGATSVAWTTGEQQNQRYSLEKQVSKIDYWNVGGEADGYGVTVYDKEAKVITKQQGLTLEKIESLLGKDIAQRIKNKDGATEKLGATEYGLLEGENLKMGGKGMKSFYGQPGESDGIVGNVAKALVKELTGEAGQIGFTKIALGGSAASQLTEAEREAILESGDMEAMKNSLGPVLSTQNSIEITPAIADAVTRGMPRFQKAMLNDGTVNGMVSNGEVFFNPASVRLDTPLHEIGGHILTAWANQNQPELYLKIIEAAKSAPEEIITAVKKEYPELPENGDRFWEEVFATVVGLDGNNLRRAEMLANPTAWQAIRNKLKEIWTDFVNFLIDNGVFLPQQSFAPEEFRDMTLADFSNLVGEKMFSGRRLSAPPPVNIKSFADYALLSDEDFLYDNYGNLVDVLPNVKRAIVGEKRRIRDAAIAAGTFMQAPNGLPSKLTEDQWLTVRTERFAQWDEGKVSRDQNGEPVVTMFADLPYFTKGTEAKPAISNTVYSDEPGDVRFQRIGLASQLTPNQQENFIKASMAEGKGWTPQQIFMATGWFRDTADKMWRYELPNTDIVFYPSAIGSPAYSLLFENQSDERYSTTVRMPLENVLGYPALYEAHPELRSLPVIFTNQGDYAGAYDVKNKEIRVNTRQLPSEMYLTLRHEIQHALQEKLGFEFGSNLSIAEEYYERKVKSTENTIRSLKAAEQWFAAVGRSKEGIEGAFEKRMQYENELEGLKNNKASWVRYMYANYAGEREARGVEQRAKLSEAERAVALPQMASGKTAIMYGDNQQIKPLVAFSEFNESGQLKSDQTVMLENNLNDLWSQTCPV